MIPIIILSSAVLAGGSTLSATTDAQAQRKRDISTTQNIVIAAMPYTTGPAANKIFCLKNFGAGVAGLVDCTNNNLNDLKQDPTYVFSYTPALVLTTTGSISDNVVPYNTTLKSAYDNLCVNFQGLNSLTVSMAPCDATTSGLSPWFVDWNLPSNSAVSLPSTSWSNFASPVSKVYAAPWVNSATGVTNGWNNNLNSRYCFQKSSAADIYAGPLNKLAAIQVVLCDSSPENRQAWFSYAVPLPGLTLETQNDASHNHMNYAVCNADTNLRVGSGAMSCEAMDNNVTVLRGNLDFTRGETFKNPFNQSDANTADNLPRITNLKVPSGNWGMSFFLDLQSPFMTNSALVSSTFDTDGLSNIFEFRSSCADEYINSIVASMNVDKNFNLVYRMSNQGNLTETFNTGLNLKTIKYTTLNYTANQRRLVIEITAKIEKISAGVKVTFALPGITRVPSISNTFFSKSASKTLFTRPTTSWASPTWCRSYPSIAPTISQLTITPL